MKLNTYLLVKAGVSLEKFMRQMSPLCSFEIYIHKQGMEKGKLHQQMRYEVVTLLIVLSDKVLFVLRLTFPQTFL